MKTSALELGNLIQGFRLSCQTEGKSPKTTEWYNAFLERFRGFLEQSSLPTRVDRVDRNCVRRFILYLRQEAKAHRTGRPLSAATVQGYVRTLKAFFAWLEREEYVKANPMTKIPVPKAEAKIVATFSEEHIKDLLGLCLASNGSKVRNTVILLLLLDCGLRVSELVGLELDDVRLSEGMLKVKKAKGGRERYVPIGSVAQKALWKYIHTSRPEPVSKHVTGLLLNANGQPLTRNGVQQMVRRYGRRAGITGTRCSPHTFRHTFAKNYLLNGGDIFSLQQILGHSSLASVRLYLSLFAVDIKKQHQIFSPVDNLARSSGNIIYRSLRQQG
jgi:site-specific recombinase XerD